MHNEKIHKGFLGIFHIWKLEMKKIFRDEGVLLYFSIVPLLYPLLYGLIYTPEVVRELPVAVLDNSNSSLSQKYVQKLDATPDVFVAYKSVNLETAQELMKERKVFGVIYIPEDFSKKITEVEEQACISVVSDMGSLLYYKALMIANTGVSLAMNKEIKLQRLGNATGIEAEIYAYPIDYEHITLFNSTSGFAAFLIPAVLILILHQTLILGVGLRAGTDREQNRFHDLVSAQKYHAGTHSLVLGKGLAYFMIYLLNTAYVLFIVPAIFRLSQIGHTVDILLFLLPFLMATVFFAMTLSVFVRNRETCIVLFVFTSVPLLFISGISWPESAISPFWTWFSYLFPSTFGINGFVRLGSMGARLHQVGFEYTGLWIQTGIYFLTTFIVYRREIILSRLGFGHRIKNL